MAFVESLPLFPLSDVVLLPGGSVPLFIFEPRYRQMTHDALVGPQWIGMVTVRPEGVAVMAGDPPIFQTGCLGRIAHAQERADGTFHILLVGESRFRILEETPRTGDRLYRSARVELLPDPIPTLPSELAKLGDQRERLLSLLRRFIQALAGSIEDPPRVIASFEQLEPIHLVNAVAQSIPFRPVERQQILEATSLLGRFEITEDLLRFKLAETGVGDASIARLPN